MNDRQRRASALWPLRTDRNAGACQPDRRDPRDRQSAGAGNDGPAQSPAEQKPLAAPDAEENE